MNNLINKILIVIVLVVIIVSATAITLVDKNYQPKKVLGEAEGQSYGFSTTTSQSMVTATGFQLLRSGSGILGRVIITLPTATTFNLYDATTTVNGGIYGTTTLAKFGSNAGAGTYMFDIPFSRGLIIEYQGNSSIASTTIVGH